MIFAIDIVARFTVILVCAALACGLLRRAPASLRHAVWIAAMGSALLMPFAVGLLPPFELPLSETMTTATFLARSPGTAIATSGVVRPISSSVASPVAIWLLLAWAFGALVLGVRYLAGAVALRRLASAALPADCTEMLRELATVLRIRRDVQVLVGRGQVSPMTWGIVRHKILLPAAAAAWSAERLRVVLAHELAHVKRHDGLAQLFVQTLCAVYWFNPLVWYAAHRIQIERERACDDHVLELGTAAAQYADHLVQIVRGLRDRRMPGYAAVSMAQPSQLETRLVSILDLRARRQALSTAGCVSMCAIVLVATLAVAAIGVAEAVPLPPVLVVTAEPIRTASAETPAEQPAAPQRTRIGDRPNANSSVIPPRVLTATHPEYTPEAEAAGIEGIVTLEGFVDAAGNVSRLRVLKGLGHGLDEKAIEAATQWTFSPATRNGAPVESVSQIEVDFRLPNAAEREAMKIKLGILRKVIDKVTSSPKLAFQTVTPPVVVSRVEPEYTPEARDAGYQGTVLVQVTVHEDGTLSVDKVVRPLEYGLTEKAVEALQQWRFKPGMRDGKAVPVSLNIEVNFNLK